MTPTRRLQRVAAIARSLEDRAHLLTKVALSRTKGEPPSWHPAYRQAEALAAIANSLRKAIAPQPKSETP